MIIIIMPVIKIMIFVVLFLFHIKNRCFSFNKFQIGSALYFNSLLFQSILSDFSSVFTLHKGVSKNKNKK